MSDEAARFAIRSQLDTTMLVEAGAGSGKTTLMVDRLVAYVLRGTPVDEIAAVTFTRKAANELRERFESRLEFEAFNAIRDDGERANVSRALRDRERMFIGTVHAFCSRILREHALDAGLPLDFSELDESESHSQRVAAWHTFLDHGAITGDTRIDAVANLGIDAFELTDSFLQYEQYRDVTFEVAHTPRPSHDGVRHALAALMERGYALRTSPLGATRDDLQKTIDRLWNRFQSHHEWRDAIDFARDASTLLTASRRKIVQKHWGTTKEEKAAAKSYAEDVEAFATGALTDWFAAWWAHAYPHVLALFHSASNASLLQRRRAGMLGFDDLLTETARLMRENGRARQALSTRWKHLLVDEFQDTDPVQAEICFLLSSSPTDGNDWRVVTLRPGSLFVVGDPKQSIYRFRRADLATYRMVESRIATFGTVEKLTRNFRSVAGIGVLVNAHFEGVFSQDGDAAASPYQASFAEFVAASTREPVPSPAVAHYWVGPAERTNNANVVADDAAKIASWIAHRCNETRDRSPQDFLILTSRKPELAKYAHELALRNLPVSASGASSGADEILGELLVVLRALADPSNAVAVIAALEGWCAGCSHADLYDARVRGMEFRITHEPAERVSPVGSALHQFHVWYLASRQLSPASLLERVVDDSGLLVLAASSDLGDRNAGQLLQIASALRNSDGTSDLTSAIAAIETALAQDDGDPSLRIDRSNAVRVMNLHKAKGLEAPVVILAAPVEQKPHEPSIATWRDAAGNSVAAMTIADASGTIVAQPRDWEAVKREEAERQNAERDRLLYVAATRAQDELVVARRTPFTVGKQLKHDASMWSPLAPVLDANSVEISLKIETPPGRRTLALDTSEVATRVSAANRDLRNAAISQYELVSVTEAAKRSAQDAEAEGSPLERVEFDVAAVGNARHATNELSLFEGVELDDTVDERLFGSLMHLALEGALRGRESQSLDEYVAALVWHEIPSAAIEVRNAIVKRVMSSVAVAMGSEEWQLLSHGVEPALAELNVASVIKKDGKTILSEGVIDAAVATPDGWLVVDWKHSAGSDAQWKKLLPGYQSQVASYVAALSARTASKGSARVVRVQPKGR